MSKMIRERAIAKTRAKLRALKKTKVVERAGNVKQKQSTSLPLQPQQEPKQEPQQLETQGEEEIEEEEDNLDKTDTIKENKEENEKKEEQDDNESDEEKEAKLVARDINHGKKLEKKADDQLRKFRNMRSYSGVPKWKADDDDTTSEDKRSLRDLYLGLKKPPKPKKDPGGNKFRTSYNAKKGNVVGMQTQKQRGDRDGGSLPRKGGGPGGASADYDKAHERWRLPPTSVQNVTKENFYKKNDEVVETQVWLNRAREERRKAHERGDDVWDDLLF